MAQERDFGQKPQLKWIKVTELYIDHEYQRSTHSDASRKNLVYIKEHFSWANFGTPIVCHVPEKKQYAVVDGQHRMLAARDLGLDSLPCAVVRGQHLSDQAGSFVVINQRRVKLHNLGAYHAAVSAGDPDAVALSEILAECSINVPHSPVPGGKTDPRQTQAVGTLLKMLSVYSKKQVVWALTIIPDAYGDCQGCMRASILRALAEFIRLYPDTDRSRMISVLQDLEIEAVEKDARSYKGIEGGSVTNAIVKMLERLYKSAGRRGAA